MMFEATATTPRLPGQSDDDYFDACCKFADEHGQAARDKGSDFHDIIQRFNGQKNVDHLLADADKIGMRLQFELYIKWYLNNVKQSLLVEAPVMGKGYAGRVDHIALLMDGRRACIDAKTQDTTKKKGKFVYYSTWGVQLGAYAGAANPVPDVLISLAFSSKDPAQAEAYEWPRSPLYYHEIFLGLLKFWREDNEYWPT